MDAKSLLDAARRAESPSRLKFPKKCRLQRSGEFRRVASKGKRVRGRLIHIDFFLGRSQNPRLGITASKKFGKAHERNRFKRIVREAFRRLIPDLTDSIEINVRPTPLAKEAKMQAVLSELREMVCSSIPSREKQSNNTRGASSS